MGNNYHGRADLPLCPSCAWASHDWCNRIPGVRNPRFDCPEYKMFPAMAGGLRQTFGNGHVQPVVDDGIIGRPTDMAGVILPTDEDLLDLADPDIMGISYKHPNCDTCGAEACHGWCVCTFRSGSSGYIWKDIDKES